MSVRSARPHPTVPDLLHRALESHASAPALSDSVRSLDYRALAAVAGAVAAQLRNDGMRPGDRVVLAGKRDARLLALMIGVMRSGAVACVLAPTWSEADVRRRLAAVTPRWLLATGADVPQVEGVAGRVVDVDALAAASTVLCDAPRPPAARVACMAFTSGSSGTPRAVAVTHGNLGHYAVGLAARLGLGSQSAPRMAHVTTLAADLGHTAWLLALATAGSVHVVDDEVARDPHGLWTVLGRERVTHLKTTPSHLRALLEGLVRVGPGLDTLLLGGEVLTRSLAERVLRDGIARHIVNHYGPTETTVGACCYVAATPGDLPADEPTVPIGTAIGDATLRLADEGAAGRGELLIGGPGVAAGYYGAPDATAQRFVTEDGGRFYRTGDVCRMRADGNLVFLGRVDREVKLRGYRVDPDEVEQLALECPGVTACGVVVRSVRGDLRMMAGVSLEHGGCAAGSSSVRRWLEQQLPAYSIPSPIIVLPELPMSANGKLDRRELAGRIDAAIRGRAGAGGERGNEPSRVEAITRLWAAALDLPAVGPDADFHEIGGDSILAMRTVALLRRLGGAATVDDVYRCGMPSRLAVETAAARSAAPAAPAAPAATGPRALGPAQRWFFGLRVDEPDHFNQAVVLRCAMPVDPAALALACRAVVARHVALRQPLTADGLAGPPRPAAELSPVSFSRLPADPGELATYVAGVGNELNRSLDLRAGRLLRLHLARGHAITRDRLIVVAHHVAVDGLSWRVLLADLSDAYLLAHSGRHPTLPPAADYYRWAATAAPPAGRAERAPSLVAARSLTCVFEQDATAALIRRFGQGRRLEALLLSALFDGLRDGRADGTAVQVETHGRGLSDDDAPYLDALGWFTAVKCVEPPPTEGAIAARAEAVGRALVDAPESPMDAAGPQPPVGFNYLGSFRLSKHPSLGWEAADELPGATRSRGGDPLARLRLTARIVSERLACDLVHQLDSPESQAARVFRTFRENVADAAGLAAPPPGRAVDGSLSGLVMHTGVAASAPALHVTEPPPDVLLTGATGYVGSHVLADLTSRGIRVTCLSRRDNPDLGDVPRAAVHVVRGDLTLDDLGLGADRLAALEGIGTVVHAAADVRLIAPPGELDATNVDGLRRLLQLVDDIGGPPLHVMSTLAVAGYVDERPRRFSEADLWIGQRFLSPYERSKFRAEELAREWAEAGGTAFVHRSGHIAAHSVTGAFQHNVADNRLYQLLRGYVLACAAPRRPSVRLAFSHVDTVAAAIGSLVAGAAAAPGVYHLESPLEIAHDEVVGWLRDFGYDVRLVDDAGFRRAVDRLEVDDFDAAQRVRMWVDYADRGVHFDSSMTLAALARRGVSFAEPTPAWRRAALEWAVSTGFLPPPAGVLEAGQPA